MSDSEDDMEEYDREDDIDDIAKRMHTAQLRTEINDETARIQGPPIDQKRKINYIKIIILGYPNLKLDPNKIYNSSAIVKNGTWSDFTESVRLLLENKHNKYKTSQSSLSSRVPKSSRPTSTRPPASAFPSAPVSTRPPKSTIAKENERRANWWALHDEGKTDEAQLRFGANKGAPYSSGVGGGSRRRRTSHRKRKSYRKSKHVRHTRRKQTRRHRHRRSRHRR